jgi:hypothetical protein
MPRCQRTFYGLGEGRVAAGVGSRRWVCGHCPDAETYETVRDPDLLNYAARSFRRCAQWFGAPGDAARPTVLVLGLRPECVHEPGERRYDLYLQRDTDPWQMRLQIGHEMFHRVCSQGRIFHWTHEMLACLVSVRLLREHGLNDYAGQTERQWLAEAPRLSPAALRAVDLWATPAYPPVSTAGVRHGGGAGSGGRLGTPAPAGPLRPSGLPCRRRRRRRRSARRSRLARAAAGAAADARGRGPAIRPAGTGAPRAESPNGTPFR